MSKAAFQRIFKGLEGIKITITLTKHARIASSFKLQKSNYYSQNSKTSFTILSKELFLARWHFIQDTVCINWHTFYTLSYFQKWYSNLYHGRTLRDARAYYNKQFSNKKARSKPIYQSNFQGVLLQAEPSYLQKNCRYFDESFKWHTLWNSVKSRKVFKVQWNYVSDIVCNVTYTFRNMRVFFSTISMQMVAFHPLPVISLHFT